MRSLRVVAIIAVFVLGASVLLNAGLNKYGVADTRQITFDAPVRVGHVLLPKGDYTVQHTMEGENHIMVFTQLHTKNPAEARVQCSLEPLPEKASKSQTVYVVNANNERVLRELMFRGDTAKHVF